MTSRVRRLLMIVACGYIAVALSMTAFAQRSTSSPKAGSAAVDLLPLTCAQAWAVSNRSYVGMLAIVRTLAHVSLLNRDLTFPNTREAGLEAGKGIADDCKTDPNALLFAVVDKQVKRVGERAVAK